MARGGLLAVAVCFIGAGAPARATDCRDPGTLAIAAPQGEFRADIIPGGRAIDGQTPSAKATVTRKGGMALTFPLLSSTRPLHAILLADGTLVTIGNHCELNNGIILAAYSHKGEVLWGHELEGLFDGDVLERLRTGHYWWGPPGDARTIRVGGDDFLLMPLWNEDRLLVRLRDGVSSYVAVTDRELGNDQCRLIRRARDLEELKEYERAVELLEKVLAAGGHVAGAGRALARVLRTQGDDMAALEILEDALRASPVRPPEGACGDYAHLWLATDLAKLYEETGRLQEAEALYQQLLGAEPAFWPPARGLAGLWLKTGHDEEADLLLSYFFEILLREEDLSDPEELIHHATWQIAHVYEMAKRHDRVRDYYRRGLRIGPFSPFLATSLVGALERLGEYDEALSVLEDLTAWLAANDGGGLTEESVDWDIRRLKAKQEGRPEPPFLEFELPGRDVSGIRKGSREKSQSFPVFLPRREQP